METFDEYIKKKGHKKLSGSALGADFKFDFKKSNCKNNDDIDKDPTLGKGASIEEPINDGCIEEARVQKTFPSMSKIRRIRECDQKLNELVKRYKKTDLFDKGIWDHMYFMCGDVAKLGEFKEETGSSREGRHALGLTECWEKSEVNDKIGVDTEIFPGYGFDIQSEDGTPRDDLAAIIIFFNDNFDWTDTVLESTFLHEMAHAEDFFRHIDNPVKAQEGDTDVHDTDVYLEFKKKIKDKTGYDIDEPAFQWQIIGKRPLTYVTRLESDPDVPELKKDKRLGEPEEIIVENK